MRHHNVAAVATVFVANGFATLHADDMLAFFTLWP
jgi:hypothetical protein